MNSENSIVLNDGKEIDLTISFARLYILRSKNKALYERYNSVVMNGMKDAFDFITVIYTAYCCYNVDSDEELITEKEFIEKVPYDLNLLMETCNNLVSPKKKTASAKHS